ncbi:MAG: replicative DNA helicase [Candidatus Niyogibacteria bacterium]|nr:replicative DNA helicase [Candidatus Niyogibacteria bacterium]
MPPESRIPPQNLEAEMSTLGSLMLDPNAVLKTVDYLRSKDFYRPNNKIIYETAIELFEKREPIDMVSMVNRLQEKGELENIGGRTYLTDLVNSIGSATNVGHYAEIVHKKGVMRELLEAAQHINDLGYKEEEGVDFLLDEAERKIFSISQASLKQQFLPVGSALNDAWERIDRLHKNKGELRGVPTGFTDLDNILSGLQASDLIVLAARPSLGKTSLALDIARNAATKHNVPVGIFSLEMSSNDLVDRLVAAEADIDLWKLRTGQLSEEGGDFARIASALDRLKGAPIFIDDEASNNILQMRAMARRLQADKGLGLIIVDYLQLMQPRVQTDSMVQQITEISRSLKQLAKELKVPVLALSQLSRAVEQRHPPVPRLSDLRDSGSIEQDSDVVMFIYREDKYKQSSDRQNQADILIQKHRNGPLGQVALYFNQHKTSFSGLSKENYHEADNY